MCLWSLTSSKKESYQRALLWQEIWNNVKKLLFSFYRYLVSEVAVQWCSSPKDFEEVIADYRPGETGGQVHYVVVAQKISSLEGAKYDENQHTSTPPVHTFFNLQQNNVPQKITFFMKIYDYENENIV